MTDPMLCAALYFDPTETGPVRTDWLDEALRLLARTGLPVREFGVSGLPQYFGELVQPIEPARARLREALAHADAQCVYLYAHATQVENLVLSCQAAAEIDREVGYAFLGVPAGAGETPTSLLTAAHRLTRLVAPCRYGIAYLRSSTLAPNLYAAGMNGSSGPRPDHEEYEVGLRIGLWHDELHRQRRHLRDGFRSAYPAQLVTDAHRAVELFDGEPLSDSGLGGWEPADGGLWLWELREGERRVTQDLMEEAGLALGA